MKLNNNNNNSASASASYCVWRTESFPGRCPGRRRRRRHPPAPFLLFINGHPAAIRIISVLQRFRSTSTAVLISPNVFRPSVAAAVFASVVAVCGCGVFSASVDVVFAAVASFAFV
jgi:hypothetical protein